MARRRHVRMGEVQEARVRREDRPGRRQVREAMMNKFLHPFVCYAALIWTVKAAAADDPAATAFFESKIRPVLVKNCYECHSIESGKSKGGLQLDSKQGIRTGGDTGPAVVPGDPGKSLLLSAIRHTDPDLEMPAKKPKLPDTVITDFETWIKAGAADTRETLAKAATERPPVDLEAGRKFWSYKKPVAAAPPEETQKDWPRRELDRFILAKLDENQLKPAEDADPVVFLRRLYFDLIGLPPSPAAADEFVKQWTASFGSSRDDLIRIAAERLLASPRFGERWGRHWLDV